MRVFLPEQPSSCIDMNSKVIDFFLLLYSSFTVVVQLIFVAINSSWSAYLSIIFKPVFF